MSNYLSAPYEQNQVQSNVDIGLVDKTLSTLQGRYDSNKAKIDQTLALYSTQLKGLRPEDNAYISAKLKEVTSAIQQNSQRNGNLAYSYNTDSIVKSISSVMDDPIVQDAVESKKNKDNYDANYQAMIKKNPKLNSEVNYAYGAYKGGLQDYMQGKAKKVGQMSYTPYTDYSKELKDITENLDKYSQDIERSRVGNDGYIYTQKGKVISPEKVKNIAESLLSDGAKKQMTINGWATYHQGNTEEERTLNTKKAFDTFKTKYAEELESQVLLSKATADKTGAETDKQNATIAETNFKNSVKSLDDIYNQGSSEQMYGLMYKEGVLGNVAKTFAKDTINETISADSTYMAKVKMAYDEKKDERDYALAVAKAESKKKEEGLTYQTKADFGATPDAPPEDIAYSAIQEVSTLDAGIQAKTTALYNNLEPDIQRQIDNEIKLSKGLKTKEDILIEYAQGGKISNSDAKELNRLSSERYVKQNEINTYRNEILKQNDASLDSETFIKELYNNPNIKMTWVSNGKERVMPVKTVLKATGIIDENGNKVKSISEVGGLKDYLKKSMLADKTLSEAYGDQPSFKYIDQLANLFGEDRKQVVLRITDPRNTSGMGQYEQINPNSKTGQFINRQKAGKAYNVDGIFSRDDSFDDITNDNYFRQASTSEINRKIGDRIKANTTTSFALTTTVRPGSEGYKEIAQQADLPTSGGLPLRLEQVKTDASLIKVAMGKVGSKDYQETILRKEDLPQATLSAVNLYNSKSIFNLNNFPPMKQKATFTETSGTNLTGFASAHYGGTGKAQIQKAMLTTKKGAMDFYFAQFPKTMGNSATPSKLAVAISNMISDSELAVATTKTENKDGIFILPKIVKGDKTIFEPVPTDEQGLVSKNNVDKLDYMQERIKFRPQEYINDYLSAVLSTENINEIKKITDIYGTE